MSLNADPNGLVKLRLQPLNSHSVKITLFKSEFEKSQDRNRQFSYSPYSNGAKV